MRRQKKRSIFNRFPYLCTGKHTRKTETTLVLGALIPAMVWHNWKDKRMFRNSSWKKKEESMKHMFQVVQVLHEIHIVSSEEKVVGDLDRKSVVAFSFPLSTIGDKVHTRVTLKVARFTSACCTKIWR